MIKFKIGTAWFEGNIDQIHGEYHCVIFNQNEWAIVVKSNKGFISVANGLIKKA